MMIADKYALKNGYENAHAMLEKLKEKYESSDNLSSCIEYAIQTAVINALRTVDESNQSNSTGW